MKNELRQLHPEFPINVTGRTNNREFFPVPMSLAWEIFSENLRRLHKDYEIQICAFVLMSNHFHAIFRDPKMNLSRGMDWFMSETTRQMNRRSGRINRLWGRRFHSTIIGDEKYLLTAHKYNYRNPVEAGLCAKVEDYPWSSLQLVLGRRSEVFEIEKNELLFNDVTDGLEWMNTPFEKKESTLMHLGLRRKIFKVPRDPKTKRLIEIV